MIELLKRPINANNQHDIIMVDAYEKLTHETMLQRQGFIEGMRFVYMLEQPGMKKIIQQFVDV